MRLERNPNVDCCASHGLRLDGNGSVHDSDALLHSDQTQAATSPRCFNFETFSTITHEEMNFVSLLR